MDGGVLRPSSSVTRRTCVLRLSSVPHLTDNFLRISVFLDNERDYTCNHRIRYTVYRSPASVAHENLCLMSHSR